MFFFSLPLLFFFFFFCSFCSFVGTNSVPALFALGDSLLDVGNNNFLPTMAKANFPPYGRQFDTGLATGRFTNGRNQIDYLASKLGLPLLQPYLDPAAKREKLLKGSSFASAGSGILDLTNANVGRLIPIAQQVKYFAEVKQQLVELLGTKNATQLLSKSLFCIFTGNNDWLATYPLQFAASAGRRGSESKFRNLLISKLLEQIRELYNLGARRFVVAGASAVGCAPSQLGTYFTNDCVQFLNDPVTRYNLALRASVLDLGLELSGSQIIFSDLFRQMMLIRKNYASYGINNVDDACCGFRRSQSCLPGARVCNNPSEYYYWDAYHPSSKICQALVDMLYSKGPPYNYPSSLQHIVT